MKPEEVSRAVLRGYRARPGLCARNCCQHCIWGGCAGRLPSAHFQKHSSWQCLPCLLPFGSLTSGINSFFQSYSRPVSTPANRKFSRHTWPLSSRVWTAWVTYTLMLSRGTYPSTTWCAGGWIPTCGPWIQRPDIYTDFWPHGGSPVPAMLLSLWAVT